MVIQEEFNEAMGGMEEVYREEFSKEFREAKKEQINDLAREYFYKCGLDLTMIDKEEIRKLKELMQREINKLLADESYSMVKELYIDYKVKRNKSGISITTSGSYFDEREAICFRKYPGFPNYTKEQKPEKEIYFCDWASGCNRIPYIKGFIEWCDWMVTRKNTEAKG